MFPPCRAKEGRRAADQHDPSPFGSRLKLSSRLNNEREPPNSGRPRASLPWPAPACARASIQAAAAAGLGRAAAAQAHAQDLQDAREGTRVKTEKSVASDTPSTQTDESTTVVPAGVHPGFGGRVRQSIHFLPAILKSLFPPEPQVNSLNVLRTIVLYRLHRQYVSQDCNSFPYRLRQVIVSRRCAVRPAQWRTRSTELPTPQSRLSRTLRAAGIVWPPRPHHYQRRSSHLPTLYMHFWTRAYPSSPIWESRPSLRPIPSLLSLIRDRDFQTSPESSAA